MKQQRNYKIVLALRLDIMPGRQELIGIFRHMKRRGLRWNIQLRAPTEITPDLFTGPGAPDGVIFAESQLSDAVKALVPSAIPVISIDTPSDTLARRKTNIVFIHADNDAIGRACRKHLADKGQFAAWGFVHDAHRRPWSVARKKAFEEAVRAAGDVVAPMTDADERDLAGWLRALPKPAAVMVACDRRVQHVMEACREAGLSIPDQVALVSVDNDEMYCECLSPTVSSLDPDFENEGVLAAAELDRLLKSRAAHPAKTIVAPAGKVVDRESTANVSSSAHLVRRALAFISANAHKGIGVRDVVAELGVSRRLADLRFQQYCGKTILETIVAQRLTKVRRLLTNSQMKLNKIAELCGFASAKHLATVFHAYFGMTMTAYRHRRK